MRPVLIAVLTSLSLSGCTTTAHFYTNDIIEATAVSRVVTAEKIDVANGVFGIYKVNGSNYALISSSGQMGDTLYDLDGALILGEKEVEALRETCRRIIDAHGKTGGKDIKVIEYHLVEKAEQYQSITAAFAYNGFASSSMNAGLYSRVPLRLQYVYQPGGVWGPAERISYRFVGVTGDMKLEQVKALLSGLQK